MLKALKTLVKDEAGATAIEYGIIVGLISVMIIAAATEIGTDIKANFEDIAAKL
jgi:pilus assembly protein Flp/PilA